MNSLARPNGPVDCLPCAAGRPCVSWLHTQLIEQGNIAVDYETFTRDITADIRANGRPTSGPMQDRPLMVLTTKGAKTGDEHEAIVTFSRDGEDYVVAATKSGAPTNPAWYHNLRANPEATVEADREKFRVRATIAEGAERERLWDQHVVAYPYFGDYPAMTARVIPVISLERID